MKKFKFSLQRIQDYRLSVYNKEKNALAVLYTEKTEIERRYDELLASLEKLSNIKLEKTKNGISVMEYSALEMQISSTTALIRDIKEKISKIDKEIDNQTKIVIDANKSVKSLDNLRERKLEEYNSQLEKAEEDRISELIMSKLISELNET